MARFIGLIVLVFNVSIFSQTTDRAVGTYSANDKLIGLSNLMAGLSDCPVKSVVGKVRDIEKGGAAVTFRVKIDKKNSANVVVPLDRVSNDDKKYIFRHLITKNNTLRVSGYACTEEAPFSAFSIDRIY